MRSKFATLTIALLLFFPSMVFASGGGADKPGMVSASSVPHARSKHSRKRKKSKKAKSTRRAKKTRKHG